MTHCKWSLVFAMTANLSFTALAEGESGNAVEFVPTKIASSATHTCILSKKGQVKCWGYNAAGELGIAATTRHGRESGTMGPSLPMVNFGTNLYAKDICVGARTTCIATTSGQVKCWGLNNSGQLGQEREIASAGLQANDMGDNLPFTNLGTDFKVKSVHCGYYTYCAVSDAGKMKCWGSGSNGELGPNISPKTSLGRLKDEMGDKLPLVALPDPVSYVAIGTSTNCAASKSNVYCWGYNGAGQAGIGSTDTRIYLPADTTTTMKVKLEDDGISTVIEGISAGYAHSCAVYHLSTRATQQKVKCWGSNSGGALGIGSTASNMGRTADTLGSKLPDTKLGLSDIVQLEGHDDYSCVRNKNGDIKCWGANNDGTLGLGDTKLRGRLAVEMGSNLPNVDLDLPTIAIASGAYSDSTCAILINHEIKCWGYALYGTLGYEDTETRGAKPDDMGGNLPYVHYK